MLKDSLIVASIKIRTVAPTVLLHILLPNLCVFRTTESINALDHGDIAIMDPAHKLDGHCCIVCEVFLNEPLVRTTIIAGLPAINRVEGLAEVAQHLGAPTVCFVLAELHHSPQHVLKSLLLLSATLALVNHLP
jgi:hypothetical protein